MVPTQHHLPRGQVIVTAECVNGLRLSFRFEHKEAACAAALSALQSGNVKSVHIDTNPSNTTMGEKDFYSVAVG